MIRPAHALKVAPYLLSRTKRMRLFGSRIETVGYLLARSPVPAVLLVRSVYGDWMPPQEGVGVGETFGEAFWRCLDEELGVEVAESERRRLFSVRGEEYLGKLHLPETRKDVGLRTVAPDVDEGHPLYLVKMRKKAYWAVHVQLGDADAVELSPNGHEVDAAEWVSWREARHRIENTVRPEKARLLLQGLDASEQLFTGSDRHVGPLTF